MSTIKISGLTQATDVASNDLFEIVDVSDPLMSAVNGTNKKITATTLASHLATIGSYAQTSHTHSAATQSVAGFMSSTDKSKLDGIASNAEVNVQANWNETTTTSDAFIQNKPGLATTTVAGFMSSTDKSRLDDASGVSGLVKCNGSGDFSAATAGTDYTAVDDVRINNLHTVIASSATLTITQADNNKYIRCSTPAGTAITLNGGGAWTVGMTVVIRRATGAGALTLAATNATINENDIANILVGQTFALKCVDITSPTNKKFDFI